MILLTPDLRDALRANDIARRTARRERLPEPDPVPLVKLFNPLGAATWLATELDEDGDTLFGLADLGFGCPELVVSASPRSPRSGFPSACASSATSASKAWSRFPTGPNGRGAPVPSSGQRRCSAAPCAVAKRRTPSFRRMAVEAPAARFAAIPDTRSAPSKRTAGRRSQGARP